VIPSAGRVPVDLNDNLLLSAHADHLSSHAIGKITNERTAQIIGRMQAREYICLQMYCQSRYGIANKNKRQKQTQAFCELFVIVYGHPRLFEALGTFFQGCGIYLQDPSYCDRNVPYRNSQCLSSTEDDVVMTCTLGVLECEVENACDITAIFDQWSTGEVLVETDDPRILKTRLQRCDYPAHVALKPVLSVHYESHQRQALTFLLRREQGWALESPNQDVWTKAGHTGSGYGLKLLPHSTDTSLLTELPRYINNVTGMRQSQPPPPFSGGIVADQMGLGKTLQMIALIASDFERAGLNGVLSASSSNNSLKSLPEIASTLIIVPLSRAYT
jgi:SWI/SNF-related matrix-associated actin-dependent regulator of chromatin subfamily A3